MGAAPCPLWGPAWPGSVCRRPLLGLCSRDSLPASHKPLRAPPTCWLFHPSPFLCVSPPPCPPLCLGLDGTHSSGLRHLTLHGCPGTGMRPFQELAAPQGLGGSTGSQQGRPEWMRNMWHWPGGASGSTGQAQGTALPSHVSGAGAGASSSLAELGQSPS